MKPLNALTRAVLLIPVFLLTAIFSGFSQTSKATLSGYLKSAKDGESLIGAGVYVEELKTGATANVYGFYSLTLPKGKYTIKYLFLGYVTKTDTVDLQSSRTLNVELDEESKELMEVVINGQKTEIEANVKSVQMSVAKMDIKTIKSIPPLLGEVDLVRAVQLLPGVTTVGEGAQGFNVRGGSIDQNLILLDEAPVFNSSHLLGFFSVFNPDAVKDVKLYKGGIPSQYGGRISSILDVRMKEGNSKKLEVNGGIGTIMSRFSIEGPIKKDKASFILAGRRSYIDVLAAPFLSASADNSRLYFYDLSGKVNYKIDDKNTVFVSGYLGRDVLRFGDQFQFNWGNATASTRWNHVFSQKLFLNTTLYASNYDYSLGVPSGNQEFSWKSNIINVAGKTDFTWYINPQNTLNFGASLVRYTFKPGKVTGGANSIFGNSALPDQRAYEAAAYVGDEWNITPKLQIQAGLRYSYFAYMGNKDVVYDYVDTLAGTRKMAQNPDNSHVGSFGLVKGYGNFEPRFSVKYEINENSSIKASYNRTAQYVHLISNTTAATPTDVWSPSTNNIKPQIGDQVALGYFRNVGINKDIELSGEVFYKDMQNQLDYVDGAQLLLNKDLEGELLPGQGRAYGLELYVKKNTGKITGWISYTLSRTERKIAGLNNESWFVSKFDRPHNLVVVASYELNNRWSFSSSFNYGTGTPNTFPNSRIEFQGLVYPYNSASSRNNYRNPDYHRLDLSASLKTRQSKKRKGEWVFSIYNVYARRNAFSVYFQQVQETKKDASGHDTQVTTPKTEAKRISIFGSIIPGITYNFNF
ncbi:MAG TPA: TonB-dependent receptor [Catalimonadaceae bacterium]|nr:TonB-dependent receptor [Catalimonadaceae bacterium]